MENTNNKLSYSVRDLSGNETGTIELDSTIFGVEIKQHIVAEIVRWQLAKRRSGNASTLTRSDVRGTTKKCKPQKEQGTRHGDKRAPIFRKGGITFGPKPRSYAYSMNKKVRAMGLKIALSDRFNHQKLIVLDSAQLSTPKTSELNKAIRNMGIQSGLFVASSFDTNFQKAMQNIPNCNIIPVVGLNVYDILKHKHLILTRESLESLAVRLG